ncbi:MAG: response regulator [Proteobacteria bacterium]|nr:response regulator [Pseudomonadota bacterium]
MNVMHEDREKCSAAGMDEFIDKPVTRARLEEVLSKCKLRHVDDLTTMGKPVCIMLIDDDELEHEIAQRALKDKDRWQLVGATSAEAGLEKLKSLTPTVILVDNRMPGIGGLEAISRIRKLSRFDDTLVFMCTGADQTKEMMQELKKLRAGYFLKSDLSGAKFPAKLDSLLNDSTSHMSSKRVA